MTRRVALFILVAAMFSTDIAPTAVGRTTAFAAPPEGFAHDAIGAIWSRDDGPVASGSVERAWMWGPGPFYTQYEPYTDAPQGNHLVQYFDKGRLEINDPDADSASRWFVTSGLLVTQLVSGEASVGGGTALTLGPAPVPLAGDTSSTTSPTYATFRPLTGRVPDQSGATVDRELSASGQTTRIAAPVAIQTARYEATTGHNWADVFWRFANAPDRPARFDWLFTLGYPITDPYWVRVPVAGKEQLVLVQLFERRTLTFNPANPAATQVEMGNLGRHYFQWRYADIHEAILAADYDVSLTVGRAPAREVTVEMSVAFTNTTPRPMDRIVLRAIWNRWDGVMTLREVNVGGSTASTRWLHGVNLEVRPLAPLPPGARATVSLSLQVKPRPTGGRSAYDRANDILSLGDMLPTLVPWENGGWLYYPFSELGDHGYYASSRYTVTIRSTGGERLVVGGTGSVVSAKADSTEWKFRAENVRDVAYLVSPRFASPLADASLTRTVGKTRLLAYFTPARRSAAQRQLDLTAPAVAWFSEKIGDYPFDTYTIGEMGVPQMRTDNYAQEYPMAYWMPSQWLSLGTTPGTWTWYIPVHEVGHQWFYSLVGSNQVADPWLDEALTTFLTAEYIRDKFPQHYAQSWRSMTGSADRSLPVSVGVFSGFRSEQQYSAVIYDTGSLMLDRVRSAMGDESFYAALRDYYSQYRFKRATPFDFIATLRKHASADLSPIFSEYLGY